MRGFLNVESTVVVLGLLLVALSGLLVAGVALSNTDPVAASAFGVSLTNVSVGGLFLAGAATGLVFGLGLGVAASGAGRRRTKRRALTQQVAAERDRRESLVQENAQLHEQLERTGSPASPRHDQSDEG